MAGPPPGQTRLERITSGARSKQRAVWYAGDDAGAVMLQVYRGKVAIIRCSLHQHGPPGRTRCHCQRFAAFAALARLVSFHRRAGRTTAANGVVSPEREQKPAIRLGFAGMGRLMKGGAENPTEAPGIARGAPSLCFSRTYQSWPPAARGVSPSLFFCGRLLTIL